MKNFAFHSSALSSGFGIDLERQVVVLQLEALLPAVIRYSIEKL